MAEPIKTKTKITFPCFATFKPTKNVKGVDDDVDN